uniref:Uncharacterized protein n=1 Tax=Magallana gigas TaxID=29159 RepID=A0A8W8ME54_MAGGI
MEDRDEEDEPQPSLRTNMFTPDQSPSQEGKIQMSLMHFHLTNPEWKPPKECSLFINDIKEKGYLSGLQPSRAGALGVSFIRLKHSTLLCMGMTPN